MIGIGKCYRSLMETKIAVVCVVGGDEWGTQRLSS